MRLRPVPHVALLVAAWIAAPRGVAAQHLEPVTDADRCAGQRIVAIHVRTGRRDPTDGRNSLSAFANDVARTLQPETRASIVRGFLLFGVGDTCDERRREESEHVLRAQRFISDAAIRARDLGGGDVALDVETIDEYSLYSAVWGLKGLPAGFDAGSTNLLGFGKAFIALLDYGRGGEVGFGVKYTDYLAFGEPLTLDAGWVNRQFSHTVYASLSRPFLSNFQRTSWDVGASLDRPNYTFHDPTLRDVTLDFERTRWSATGSMRLTDALNGPVLGVVLAASSAVLRDTYTLGSGGLVPVSAPPLVARYGSVETLRAGLTLGARAIRFVTTRGFGAISAPEEQSVGVSTFVSVLRSIDGPATATRDVVVAGSADAGLGTATSLLAWSGTGEVRLPDAADERRSVVAATRLAWMAKANDAHFFVAAIDASGVWNTRIPAQLNFREDDSGLEGYRSTDLGGARLVVARAENRFQVPSPYHRMELAIATLFEAGRLWAGDTPYGVDTPWYQGAGLAFIGALPSGAKQTLRLDIGVPLNLPGRHAPEVRISYAARGGWIGGTHGALDAAREGR